MRLPLRLLWALDGCAEDGPARYDGAPMPWLSLPEYSRRTGTPESTVRLMIRADKLEAHREARAPGDPRDVWKVWLDDPPEPPVPPPTAQPQHDAPQESAQAQPDAPDAATRALEILSAALDVERQERQQLAAELRAESAARAAAEARVELLAAERDEARAEVERLRMRRWFKPSTW